MCTMVIKLHDFVKIFFFFEVYIYSTPKASCYIYLGIPFGDDPSLQLVISNIQAKVRKTLFSFFNFLTNNKVPLSFKKYIL